MSATATRQRSLSHAPPMNGCRSEACIILPKSAYTLAGFRAWTEKGEHPEHLRAAFIDGEIYLDMSKEELYTHVAVKSEVSRGVMNLNREIDKGEFYADGTQVANPEANLVSQPDGCFVTWESLEAGLIRLVPREGAEGQYIEIEGTPDWIMEIVSNSSVGKDYRHLRVAYHRARIPEYWLIDARGDEILFQILLWRKSGYAAAPNRDGWQRSRVFGRSFRLTRSKGRHGLWRYTLEVRP